ncbi:MULTISPECIES: TonB-dependent receptor [unclassified Helicobacter]|uniref:TonB-dependent receptor n=1 Tax=unclassified Helicobacter TaxID=2593540 RepID=UPI000CF036B9|nr:MULTISPECIES: TonB-dependent receptor [unclassified Helicobacter]
MKKYVLFFILNILSAQILELDTIERQDSFEPRVQLQKEKNTITQDQLNKYSVTSTTQLSKYFSNLRIYAQGSDTFPMVSFRGVSSPDYYSSVLGVYVDGIPQSPNFLIQNLSDVENIVLVSGAEGLFYGENAPLGLIDIQTRSPLGKNYADAHTTFSLLREDINLQVGWQLLQDRLWGKANFRFIRDNGFIKDPKTNKMLNYANSWNVGASLYYQILDNLFLSSHYSFYHTFSRKDFFLTQKQIQKLSLENDDKITWEEFVLGEQNKILNKTPYLNLFAHNASVKLEYLFSNSTLNIISAFSKNNTLANSYPGIYVQSEKNDGYYYDTAQFIQELRLHTSHKNNLESLFGAYYKFFILDNGMVRVPTEIPLGYSGNWDAKEKVNTFALYGNTSFHWGNFTLHTGLRYQFFHTFITSLNPPVMDISPYSNSAVFHAINPRVALYYQPSKNSKIFIELSNSTKPGGFAKFPFADTDTIPYGSEQIYNMDLGGTIFLFDSKLQLKSSLYANLRTNTQSYVGVGYYKSIKNIGNAYAMGLDLQIDYHHGFFMGFANINFGVSKFMRGGKNQGEITILGNKGFYDLSGLVPKFSPLFSLNIGSDFDLLDKKIHKLTLSTLLNYSSSYYIDDFNRDEDMKQKGYFLLDCSLNYSFAKYYSLSIFAQNIFNTRYITSVIWDSKGKAFTIGDPLNIGIRLGFSF